MIAVSLFDVLARDSTGGPASNSDDRVQRLARKLIEDALMGWRRLLEFEREFATCECSTPALADERNRAMYQIYQAWAAEAEQVLSRIRQLAASGRAAPNADELEDAHARVRARLGLTPEMISRAMEQVRQGQARPLKELRDELLARVRT